MSKAKFEAARELIREKKYTEARALLKTIDHPQAQEWLSRLDKLAPSIPDFPNIQPSPAPMQFRELEVPASGGGCRRILGTIAVLFALVVIVAIATQSSRPSSPPISAPTLNPTQIITVTAQAIAALQTSDAEATNIALTPSATIIDTPVVRAEEVTSTPAAFEVTPRAPAAYYVRSLANARICADTSCESLGKFQQGETMIADGITRGGDFEGNSLWYRTTFNGQTAYVNTALVIESELISHPQPTQPPLVSAPVQPNPLINACDGIDNLNCTDFASGGADAHVLACGRDEDDLDHDGDGDACEPGWN